MKLNSIIKYCNDNHIAAYIMDIDFEKAFDCLEWDALEAIMKEFNFGPHTIELIQICY